MKKLKKSVLSVLLFSFSFLLLHDYVMADLNVPIYSGQTSVELSTDLSPKNTNIISEIHESIHIMITHNQDEFTTLFVLPNMKPPYIKLFSPSYNDFVLERPPLS